MWNILLHCVTVCCYDWFNKEVDWPIAEQDKVQWESQTENAGKEKQGVQSCQRGREKQNDPAVLTKGTM